MILDRQNTMSDGQAVTATAASTDVIDFGPLTENTERDIGVGEPVYLVIGVDETVTADGAATVTFALQTDTVENFASPTALWTSAAIGKATLVDGYRVVAMAVPHGVERYLRVNYTVATGPLTAGKFDAFLVKDVEAYRAYANRYINEAPTTI